MDMYNNPAYSFINGGARYTVYAEKKTVHGVTALIKTESNRWIVANGLRFFIPTDPTRLPDHADWNHGHYFMENKAGAIRYYESVH